MFLFLFLYLVFPYLFSTSPFLRLFFLFVIFLFSLLFLISFFFSCFFTSFSSSLYLIFCQKYSFFWIYVCLFGTLPLSVVNLLFFSSLRRAVALFVPRFSDLLRFLILLFLIFFYQSSFLGLFKNCCIFFWKITKISLILPFLFFKKKTHCFSSFCDQFFL